MTSFYNSLALVLSLIAIVVPPKKASLNQIEILNRRWKSHSQESAKPRARKTTAVMAPEYLMTFTFTLKRFEEKLMNVN